jgi:hypothetical protein
LRLYPLFEQRRLKIVADADVFEIVFVAIILCRGSPRLAYSPTWIAKRKDVVSKLTELGWLRSLMKYFRGWPKAISIVA